MASPHTGRRIQEFRVHSGLSPEDMAARTGLSVSFLTDIEQSPDPPAIGILAKISRALGTRLGTFMDDEITPDPLIIRHTQRTADKGLSPGGTKNNPEGMTCYPLGKGKADRHMEPLFITFEPGAPSSSKADRTLSSHEGEEFIVVLSGEILLSYGGNDAVLGPGDSMYYNSVVPHCVGCHGTQPAQIYAVLYVPF